MQALKTRWITATGIIIVGLIEASGGAVEIKSNLGFVEKAEESGGWVVVNDGVMGGISQSRVLLSNRKTLLFSGTISFENNGGFASIRHEAQPLGIGRGAGIRLRVKGDGKKYQLRVRTSNQFDGIAYKADFTTVKDEGQDLRIPWGTFSATYRGRSVPDAPALKGDAIQQIGFLIAGQQEGKFELEIEGIDFF